jgi:hypothetical protein
MKAYRCFMLQNLSSNFYIWVTNLYPAIMLGMQKKRKNWDMW